MGDFGEVVESDTLSMAFIFFVNRFAAVFNGVLCGTTADASFRVPNAWASWVLVS